MQDQFWKLVKDADVWVNSYLHLDRKGVSPQTLAAVKPEIVCVEMRGYGFRGAWAERGGFEQHGQSVTLPTVTATGPLGEMWVLPPQVDLSEFKLGPRSSGDPNGASKLDWSVFTQDKHQ